MNWINNYGLIVILLLLVPNIIYAFKYKKRENKCHNKAMNILEQVGRYGSMFLMVFPIGVIKFGFSSNENFIIWLIATVILLLLYWGFWMVYFKSNTISIAIVLAIIPSIIFLLSGYMLRHYLLIFFGALFSLGHIYVTYENNQ